MCRAADSRLRPYPTSAERGPQTASWRGLRAQEFGVHAGMGAMGVIIPSVRTVPRVWFDCLSVHLGVTCGMTGGHNLADTSG